MAERSGGGLGQDEAKPLHCWSHLKILPLQPVPADKRNPPRVRGLGERECPPGPVPMVGTGGVGGVSCEADCPTHCDRRVSYLLGRMDIMQSPVSDLLGPPSCSHWGSTCRHAHCHHLPPMSQRVIVTRHGTDSVSLSHCLTDEDIALSQ